MLSRSLALSAALILASTSSAQAQGTIIERPCSPRMDCVIRPNPRPMLERLSSAVRVELAHGVARYEVTETFVNRGGRVAEADYLYPMPHGAAFQDLKLSINGELVSGETMNAAQARQIYEQIVARLKDPALVEWMGYGLLRTRIFPINPGEEKTVVVRFSQVAEREGDAVRVDYFRGNAAPGAQQLGGTLRFRLAYSNDDAYGRPYSPTHELNVRSEGGQSVVEIDGGARELTVLLPVRSPRRAAISMLPQADGGDARYALITLTPPALTRDHTARDVTFVLDISGSMSGRKMEQAKAAGRQLLATLSPQDRVRIIAFSSDVRTFRDGWTPATTDELSAARNYLEGLDAVGGTNIMGALREAMPRGASTGNGRLSLVLFLTDGAPSVGEQRADVIADSARAWRGDRRLFTFGLGSDVNISLLEQLALSGRGTAQFARPDENVERMVGLTASRLMAPVVTDLKVRADGVRLVRTMPAGAQDLFAGQDLVLLTQYEGSGRGTLHFDGRTPSGNVSWAQDVTFPDRETGNSFVPRLWATQRIGWLSAEKRRNNSSELDAEIRTLGEKFGIPTEFTSYLVVEPGLVTTSLPRPMNDIAQLQARRQSVMSAVGSGSAAPASAMATEANFAMAKAASRQRDVRSLGSMNAVASTETRAVAGRTFVKLGDAWTDVHFADVRGKSTVIKVKAYSPAYFAVVRELPRFSGAFALGEHIVIAGKQVVLEIAADGVEALTGAQLEQIRRGLE